MPSAHETAPADLLSARLGLGQDKLDSLPLDTQRLYGGAIAVIN